MSRRLTRRRALKRGGTALFSAGLLAGCSGGGGGSSDGDGSSGDGSTSDGGDGSSGDGGSGATTTSGGGNSSMKIAVGSWNYAEQQIWGWMQYEVLDNNTSHEVLEEVNYGNHEEVWNAFQDRVFHTYPDYTGTMWTSLPLQRDPIRESMEAQYEALKEELEATYDLTVLKMTPFQNSFGFAAKPSWIEKTGVETISDLASYINEENSVRIAMQQDFFNRNDGWPGLTEFYGINDSAVSRLKENDSLVRTNIGVEGKAVAQGKADVALIYTTNAGLDEAGLEIVEDDEAFWPYYNIVPTLANEKATSEVKTELNKLPGAIEDAKEMQQINGRVSLDGEDPREVATSVLKDKGII